MNRDQTWRNISMNLSSDVPEWLKDWRRARNLRKRHPNAAYIRSGDVSLGASLGRGVGVGKNVVINEGVTIGDFSYLSRGALVMSGMIGRFCSIGHYAIIGPEEHPLNTLSTSPVLYGASSIIGASSETDELGDPPTIGHDVWIGSHAQVLQGVSVGHGAVIAAGAVVTKNVEPYSIVGGAPARQIRFRLEEPERRLLLDLSWWDWPLERIRSELGTVIASGPFRGLQPPRKMGAG